MVTGNLHDEIAMMARELYEKSGYIKGRDLANWIEAEMIVLARHASQVIEEPELPTIADTEEEQKLERAQSERYPATQETNDQEAETFIEEIEVKESSIAPKRVSASTGLPEKIKPAKKSASRGKTASKVKKGATKKKT